MCKYEEVIKDYGTTWLQRGYQRLWYNMTTERLSNGTTWLQRGYQRLWYNMTTERLSKTMVQHDYREVIKDYGTTWLQRGYERLWYNMTTERLWKTMVQHARNYLWILLYIKTQTDFMEKERLYLRPIKILMNFYYLSSIMFMVSYAIVRKLSQLF